MTTFSANTEFDNKLGMNGLRIESLLVHPYKLFHNLLEKQLQSFELMVALGEREKERKEGKRPKEQQNGSDRDRESRRKES